MLLSKNAIKELIDSGKLVVKPTVDIKEVSIKIHIFSIFGKKRDTLEEKSEFTLQPKEFTLALTHESFVFPDNYAGLYDNHISMSSRGVLTHLGSMLIEPGFSGQLVLEIFNTSDEPIKLKRGMRVGNLMILQIKNTLA